MAEIEKIRVVQDRTCQLDLPVREGRGEFLRRIEYIRPVEAEGEPLLRVAVGLENASTHWPNFEAPSVPELVIFGRAAKAEAKRWEGRAEKQDQIAILKEAGDAAVGVLAQALMELRPNFFSSFPVSDRAAMDSGMVKDRDF